jgi:hypothetical protein
MWKANLATKFVLPQLPKPQFLAQRLCLLRSEDLTLFNMGGGRSRKTHSSRKSGQINKRITRKKWLARHVDQVWEDIRKPAAEVHQPGLKGPMGTTAKCVGRLLLLSLP